MVGDRMMGSAIVRLACAILLAASPVAASEDGVLGRIEILSSNGTASPPFSGRERSGSIPDKLAFGVEFGEDIAGQTVRLTPTTGLVTIFRIQVRFQTALAVGDAGPHLDLIGWHGCLSEWRTVEPLHSSRMFRLPSPTTAEANCFPTVSADSIRDEVARRGGDRWAVLVKDVRDPKSDPLYVGVSYMHIRIQREVAGVWHELTTVEVRLPLGC